MAENTVHLHSHTRSIQELSYDIWRSPNRFTKNPDIVETVSGRLLLVYSDNDAHWSQVDQIITVLASDDRGKTWFKLSEVDRADLRKGDERLVTPRLSSLSDGRLVIIVDHDDFGHFHEEQSFGNWLYWSEDFGLTWSEHQETAIPGFEPDRIIELPDGRLSVLTHLMRSESMEFAEIMSVSEDGGKNWKKFSTVADDGYHRFCEGAMVIINGGREMAVVMRENHCAGFPCYVVFSRDGGRNWTVPEQLPFSFHRPYVKQLQDGRVMVTGRNLLGGIGTYAWTGDLKAEAGYYEIGGPMADYDAAVKDGELVITNGFGLDCRYTLLPQEDIHSEVDFEAEISVSGNQDEAVAFIAIPGMYSSSTLSGGAVLYIMPNGIAFDATKPEKIIYTDMTCFHRVRLHAKHGLLTAEVDGHVLINKCYYREGRAVKDFYSPEPGGRLQFGQAGKNGTSRWKWVECRTYNTRLPDFWYRWDGDMCTLPDEYQRNRLTLIHANLHPVQKNTSGALTTGADHGYSSWLQLNDGTVVFVDYTNLGDPKNKSHLVAARFRPEDV